MTLQGHSSNQGNATENRENSYGFGWGPGKGSYRNARAFRGKRKATTGPEPYRSYTKLDLVCECRWQGNAHTKRKQPLRSS